MFPTVALYIKHGTEGADLTIHQLIEEQRHRMNSSNSVERLAAALLISGALAERLNQLSDRPVGQLLLDEVWSKLSLLTPESAICLNAVDRLQRSASGELTNESTAREQENPSK